MSRPSHVHRPLVAVHVVLDHIVDRDARVVRVDVDELWVVGRVRRLRIVDALKLILEAAWALRGVLCVALRRGPRRQGKALS